MTAVNRKTFQMLSQVRIREAHALLRAREYSGAYYLAGYAVECALKACIARNVKKFDFPDRQLRGRDPYVHDLEQLAFLAGLKEPLRLFADSDKLFGDNWHVVSAWTEQSRYDIVRRRASERIMDAIMEDSHGVMRWVAQRW
jgi:HEPN domain-containing protein